MNEEELADHSFSDSSDSETELQQQVVELERALSESPYHYDSHVELIQLLRQQGDLDKARQARKNMSDIFPLSESIWLQWFHDELPLTVLPEAALELRMLFEKATEDYLSVPIWQEYIKFATERMPLMPEGMEYPRDVMERAITACGLHVSKSGLLWAAYIEFETVVLNSLQQMQQNDSSDDNIRTQVEAQFDKVDKIFKRCLAVPHIGMETVFQEYQSFSDNAVSEENLPAYARAKKKLEDYLSFENKLLSSDPPSLDSYLAYISNAVGMKSDPTFINVLYQRAIADHSLDTKLWYSYLAFLDSNFSKISSVLLPGYKQSVRNCPWMADFWIGYSRALERNSASHEEVIAIFEKALVGNLSQGKDQLHVWTAYCDYLRRRVTLPTDDDEVDKATEDGNLVELRKTFKRARDDLEAYFGKDGDPSDSLARYQASLESSCYGNMEEARRIWDNVMSRHGKEAKYWIEYAEMERHYGNEAACRKLLQRSVNSASDDPECVCEALMQFEREVGTLESFELAHERCRAQMKRVRERREKAVEKEALKKEELKKKRKEDKALKKRDKTQTDKPLPQQEQQRGQGSKRKRMKPSHVFYDDSDEETEPIKRPKASHDDQKRESPNDHPTQTQVAMETEPGDIKVVGPRESRTVFVSNLSEETSEDDLRKIFSKCGSIADVRLIKTRRLNRLNTYAYVEFSTPEPVGPALELDRQDLQGKPMYVSPFKEKGDSQLHPSTAATVTTATTGASGHHERSNKATVFVSNIQRTVEEDQLQELFQQCGTIKEVRLIKNRAGRSKGFAYIEFVEESSANIAVARLNQHQLAFKRIKVAISNPPKKADSGVDIPRANTGGGDDSKMKSGKPDGGFTKPSFVPRRAMNQPPPGAVGTENPHARRSKSLISLLPRAVARQPTAESANTQETSKNSTKKMSNDDFRQLLLKKQ